jgi:hypothetical protein
VGVNGSPERTPMNRGATIGPPPTPSPTAGGGDRLRGNAKVLPSPPVMGEGQGGGEKGGGGN